MGFFRKNDPEPRSTGGNGRQDKQRAKEHYEREAERLRREQEQQEEE